MLRPSRKWGLEQWGYAQLGETCCGMKDQMAVDNLWGMRNGVSILKYTYSVGAGPFGSCILVGGCSASAQELAGKGWVLELATRVPPSSD